MAFITCGLLHICEYPRSFLFNRANQSLFHDLNSILYHVIHNRVANTAIHATYARRLTRKLDVISWNTQGPSCILIGCMISSVSEQDEPNRALWLATRAVKMELSCPFGTTRCAPQETFSRQAYNKSFIDQACSVKMAGYWPRSFFASLWTSTSSRSMNMQKKNLANIQPSWPHTWSITHT